MFLELRRLLPRFRKVARNITKNMIKHESLANNPEKKNIMATFDAYTTYNYRQ